MEIITGTSAQALDTEVALSKEVYTVEEHARNIIIQNEAQFKAAAEFGRSIKAKQTQVKEFFEPMRMSAKRAYDEVLSRRKQMLDPLEAAEKIVKQTMSEYRVEEERRRKAAEETARKEAEEAAKQKLDEAAALEKAGNYEAAAYAMSDAEVMDDYAKTGIAYAAPVKTAGVSSKKDWEIESVDPALVPVSVAGIEIRPVDIKAVLKLVRATKGAIQIPGIKVKETSVISIRK